jgi:hypothetical protein
MHEQRQGDLIPISGIYGEETTRRLDRDGLRTASAVALRRT